MDQAISFYGSNSALQVGINHGPITATFPAPDLDDKLPMVHEAAFGSYMDQHEDECLPGTRNSILHQIREWAFSPQGKCMFWLNGMAGTGKSTISRTVATTFSQTKSLGAAFFFRRGGGDRGNAIKFVPTVARQLVLNVPQLLPGIQKAVYDDPGIAGKTMKEQFDKLLLKPLLILKPSDLPIQTVVIVIDALDECEGDNDIRLILQLLPQLRKSSTISVRVFLTGRPELPIRLGFSKISIHDYEKLVLHEIPEEAIKHDISLFLNYRLSEIRAERSLPSDWPGTIRLQNLLNLSVPLFIFAATICRIFEDSLWDPEDSLNKILTHRNDKSQLHRTYLPVLDRLFSDQSEKQKRQIVQEFQQVVGAIVLLESPLSVISLSRLLSCPERLIRLRLAPLQSVLSVPDENNLPVRLFHLSFRDFLIDLETREKTPFWVHEKEIHYRLTERCLLECRSLWKNICRLSSDGKQRAEIDRQTIDLCLPPELQYACRYWAHHLVQCADSDGVINNALLFLRSHFLHWVEAMSLLGLALEVVGIINLLQTVLSDNHTAMLEFLHDAKRFILKTCKLIDETPLQLYCSGLIFAPRKSIIWLYFKSELPTWIHQLPQVEESWNAELQTLEGHMDSVLSVAFSPNGRLLASGSSDYTIRLWDTATGVLQQTLEGHSGAVQSVTFSPDGRLLISGSEDCTVRLWDTITGALQQTLKGYSGTVYSVVSSPDGRLLASSSYDQTIQLWDIVSGALYQTLEGHLDLVRSIAFSPDGQLLASGSHDQTIRLWETVTGTLYQTLKGHSYSIRSVAFSPDGRLLASGSHDKTILLWDITTGGLQKALKHSSAIYSVAFSPDSRLLVSSSKDQTVQFWDIAKGTIERSLKGHSGIVYSVAFSPDGRLLASSSHDQTVRLWDTVATVIQQTSPGHPSAVQSIAFSPDGRQAVSGSYDQTIRRWDVATGALQRTWRGYLEFFFSVASSPEKRLLISGSNNQKIQCWDPVTGDDNQILEGHLDLVQLVALSPDSRPLASSSEHSIVRLWDMARGALQHNAESYSHSVRSVAFSPDNRLLASGSIDKIIRIWDIATGLLNQTLEGHSGPVQSVAFSLDGRCLISGSSDRTVRLWDLATGMLQQTLRGHSDIIYSVALSPNGWLLASGSDDHTIRLWDITTGVLQQTLKGDSGAVQSVAFSPDGRLLASGSYDQNIRLWDTTTGALEKTLEGHLYSVRSVTFSPDGRLLASGSNDSTVRLWNVATYMPQQVLEARLGSVWSVNFSPDSRLLAAGSHDNTIQLWDTATGALHQTLEGHSSAVQSVFSLLTAGYWPPALSTIQ